MKEPISLFEIIKGISSSFAGAIICVFFNKKFKKIENIKDTFVVSVNVFVNLFVFTIPGYFSYLFVLETDYISNNLAIFISFLVSVYSIEIYNKLKLFINEYKFNKKDSD